MKIGKFKIARDGIHWLTMKDDGPTLVISHNRIPRLPAQFGNVIAITDIALLENPASMVALAYDRVLRDALNTDKELRGKGKRGLNLRTLQFYYVPATGKPDPHCDPLKTGEVECDHDHNETLIGWKAAAA